MATNDEAKTKEQLIAELDQARQQIAELGSALDRYETSTQTPLGSTLRDSPKVFLETILNNIQTCIWVTEVREDGTLVWTYNNPADKRLTGLNLCRPGGVQFEEVLPAEQAEFNRRRCLEVIAQGKPVTFEDKFLVDGEERWSLNTLIPLYNTDGTVYQLIGTGIDITPQKKTAQQLRETQERLVKAFNTPHVGLTISREEDGVYLDVNPGTEQITGYSRAELIGHSSVELGFLSPAERQQMIADLKTRGYLHHRELSFKTRQGEQCTILFSIDSITLDGEACLLGIVVDITEQRRTARTLREREGLLQAMIENLPFDFFLRDRAGQLIRQSNQPIIHHQPGSPLEEATIDEATRLEWQKNHQRVLAGETLRDENSYQVAGETRHFYEILVPVYVEQEVEGVLGISIDITDRKKIEEALQEYKTHLEEMVDQRTRDLAQTNDRLRQEIRFRQRVEQSLRDSETRLDLALQAGNHGFWDWNVESGDLYIDPRWHQMLEYEPDDLKPHISTLEEICHPMDYPKFMKQIEAHLQDAASTTFEAEYRFLTASGEWRWLDIRSKIVALNEQGQALRMIGTATDITERKQIETRVKNSLEEKEVLLKEIHHRVKNNLQIISSLLYLQGTAISDQGIRRLFEESQNRIRSMAFIHEQLYRSEDLAQIDMTLYVQELARHLSRAYEAHTLRLRIQITHIMLSVEKAIPCGLIINELVSNAMKYAFPPDFRQSATGLAEIGVALRHVNGAIELTVTDNGVGLPEGWDVGHSTSLGLTLVTTLVKQLGGQLDWANQPGATFTIRFKAE